MDAGSRPSPKNAKLMLQTLLADRFQLKSHGDTREMPAYLMTVAKSGVKMKARTEGDGGEPGSSLPVQGARMPGRNTTVQFLATGGFDFVLSWRPDPRQFHGTGDKIRSDPNDPDLFTAMREQLGPKLTAQKGMAPVIVVDNAEKPSAN
jgi:hypothetical protein